MSQEESKNGLREEQAPEAADNNEKEAPEELDPLEAVTKERDELKDRFLRLAAETENYKKRSEREKSQFLKRANESLVKDLLPVLDNLERALDAAKAEDEGSAVVAGLGLIHQELWKVLERHGLTPVEAMGQAFDPEFHEAMMQQEDADQEENTVLAVMQKGYTFQDRLLRPAMVIVSKKPAAPAKSQSKDDGGDGDGDEIKITVN